MYSESDIDGAIAAGAISPETAAALRNHVAQTRSAPVVDEEHFRLLTGFNDIFVAIALCLSITAIGQIGNMISPVLSAAGVAAASWLGAEYFTRRRRMALPSILLMLGFVGGVAATQIAVVVKVDPDLPDQIDAVIGAGIAAVTGLAAYIHWRRFMVPITVAAGALSVVGVAIALTLAALPQAKDAIWPILLGAGVIVFLFAMWWDMSDKERRTRRSDVAFWLHLAAAPMIAHPIFQMLGVFGNDIDVGKAVIVLALYLVFAFVALAVDRRALLVSSLVYVLYAMYTLFKSVGAIELSASLTAFVIGFALLTLSVFWHPMRGFVVSLLGGLRNRLPPVQQVVPA